MAKIYEISEIRARQTKLAKLKEIFGKLFHRNAILRIDLPMKDLDYILPPFLIRNIDELNLGELDDFFSVATRSFSF